MMVRLLKSSRSSGLVVNEALREAGGERCVWCDAFLAAFSIFSFSSLLFRRFSPFDSDPPTTQSLFPGQKRAPRSRAVWNRKKERQTQGMREREREGGRERRGKGLSEGSNFFFSPATIPGTGCFALDPTGFRQCFN